MQSESIRRPFMLNSLRLIPARALWTAVFILLTSIVFGCGSSKRESTGIDKPVNIALLEVHELYFTFDKAEAKPPAKLADFDKLKHTWPRGYKAIQSGDIVVLWGASLPDDAPIAYEKGAPEKGGLVLFGSGATKTLTPEAFDSLVKK
jgi:hypothetical protein